MSDIPLEKSIHKVKDFITADEKVLAEQLTWKDFDVFKRIETREFLNQV